MIVESETGRCLQAAIQDRDAHAALTNSFSKRKTFDELNAIRAEASDVSWSAFNNAKRLLDALPIGLDQPSVGIEPDGFLTFEWHRNPSWTFSVSIGESSTLYYAALFGNQDPRGTCRFTSNEVPQILISLITQALHG